MPEAAQLAAMAPCWVCRVPFVFDAGTVPVVLVDPATGLPPDLGPSAAGAQLQRWPLCPRCVARANLERLPRGLEPITAGPRGWVPGAHGS